MNWARRADPSSIDDRLAAQRARTKALHRLAEITQAAMVRAAAAMRDAGATVTVLALVDPASRTQGTMHTVRLARDAGLTVDVRTWGHLPSPRV